MTGFPQPDVRVRPDWSFVSSGGPGCRWEGPELTLLGFALGGVHPPAHSWLIDLKALTGALQEVYGPRFALGDRDLLLQRAVDAKAEGHPRLAGILADMIRFPPLSYAERSVAVGTLSRTLGHGRKSGFSPRVSFEIAWPPRLSLAFNDRHWPAGSPGGIGGQFAPRETGVAGVPSNDFPESRIGYMREALDRRSDLTQTVRQASIEIFEVEGLGKVDRDGGATAGITEETFARAKAARVSGIEHVRRVADLTYDQIVSIYKWHFDVAMADRGGIDRLDAFADRRTAIAIADTLFAHGATGGPRMLRGAAERLLKSLAAEERRRLGLPATVGKDTSTALDVLRILSDQGRAQAVRTAIASQRRDWLERRKEAIWRNADYSDEGKRRRLGLLAGWPKRIKRFE